MPQRKIPHIESFDFIFEHTFARKYQVMERIGEGWEGEVFLIREIDTGIERAAKLFYPERNVRNRTLKFHARKLHKLRHCPILIQYHTQETIFHEGVPVSFVISEFVEGEKLSEFLKRQPGGRLPYFQGLHLLYAMAKGMEPIHRLREYHGDLHPDNVMVQRVGLAFDLKVLDFFNWNAPRPESINDDVCDMLQIFKTAIGGDKFYSQHPKEVKEIVCGLKRTLILKKYRTAGQLRQYLENMQFYIPEH